MRFANIAVFASALVLVAFLAAGGASAAQPNRLNITMAETVDQNVTYAENFDLEEETTYCLIRGVVNVTNPNNATVSDINLTFSNTIEMDGNFSYMAGRQNSQIMGASPGDIYVVHINELRAQDYSTFNYTVNCTQVKPPLNIDTNYSNLETNIRTKVLAGHDWTLLQNASNQLAINEPINDLNVTINTQPVQWNDTEDNFTLSWLYPEGDYANVHGNGTSNQTWWWSPNGGTLNTGDWEYVRYNVTAPTNVPTSATYLSLIEDLEYRVEFLSSNLSLDKVMGKADADFSFNKRIVEPATEVNDTNVTWEVDGNFTAPLNISYNLSKVSVWVTSTLDPTNRTTPFGRLDINYTPGQEVNQTSPWVLPGGWRFNYTDASDNITSRPPVVWMKPYFTIMNSYGQIVNSSVTRDGEDYYLKYIYVVNGYWLQIDKNITSIGEDQYKIDTLVQNVGNAPTPEGLVVTVYDFVPAEFSPWNWTKAYDSNKTVLGAGFNGTAYRWSIPPRGTFNASLNEPPNANSTWDVSYTVNGTGEYKVSELYVVGLDPRKVEGAGTHEGITVSGAFTSRSAEVFYVAVVFFLIVINVVNFVMTRRISKKLNRR